jgi:amino acid transporter
MAFVVAGIVVLISSLAFAVLMAAMPRSGGGYVAISRVLGPFWAFIASWMEFIAISSYVGFMASYAIGLAFSQFGPALGIISGERNDVSIFAAGLMLVVVFIAIVALGGVRITSYVLQPLVWIPAILTFYVIYLLGSAIANPSVLQNGLSAWAQAQGTPGVTADAVVKVALKQGLDEVSVRDYWTAVSNFMIGAYFAYLGYAATTYIAGEVKDANQRLPKILLAAPIVIMATYVTMTLLLTYASASVGQITLPNGHKWSFYEAYSFLSYGGGSLSEAGLPFRANGIVIAGMSGIGLGLGSLNILVFLFGILWIVNDVPPFVLTASRIVFAMSFDRVLPASFSNVNNRFHSPVNAGLLVGLFSVFGCLTLTGVISTGGSWSPGGAIGDLLNGIFNNGFYAMDLIEQVFLTLFAVALVLLPYRRRRIFDAAPFKPGGKLGVTAIGIAGVTANLVFGWLVLASPLDSYNILAANSDNLFALGFDILLGLSGAVIYGYYRWGPPRKEIDYATIFSEVPPE